jgi:flagellar biosynthesis repressor protein FlbT
MALRFELGPYERVFIGKSVLTNGANRTKFVIEGDTPVLRSRDVLLPEQAVSPFEKLYYNVQQMYLEEDTSKYQGSYLKLAARTLSEFPGCYAVLQAVDGLIKSGQHYQALKELRKFMDNRAHTVRDTQSEGSLLRVAAPSHN